MAETPRHGESQKPADRTAEQADPSISDLSEQVKAEDAKKVRGGSALNPQPLPPVHNPDDRYKPI